MADIPLLLVLKVQSLGQLQGRYGRAMVSAVRSEWDRDWLSCSFNYWISNEVLHKYFS